jgi:hypothetical protein
MIDFYINRLIGFMEVKEVVGKDKHRKSPGKNLSCRGF